MSAGILESAELTDTQFNRISDLVKSLSGINLHDGKKELVKARLCKRLRTLGFKTFDHYIDHLCHESGSTEVVAMLDAISTNLTSFFREPDHFEHLADSVLPSIKRRGDNRLRIWSAGCSTGEEPYSIAITVLEELGSLAGWDARVLATDISTKALAKAAQGQYHAQRIGPVQGQLRSRHFTCVQSRPERIYRVSDAVRSLVSVARLNLMESWPMRGPFDVIFCRNVMIYFDKATQGRLVERFWQILAPGGTLFIGHSESLTGVRHGFRYVQPTIYEKR